MPTPILIVDDDPDIRESLSDMLSHEGYDVQSAATGSEALRQAAHEHYGAAVLDIQLPDLNGLSVLKVMMELDPSLPVIILTGNATQENTIGSLTKGAFAYLSKPYNSQELKAILRRAVSMRGLAVRAEHVEEALLAGEERFRALIESAADAIVLADHGGHIIGWNGAAERMFGHPKRDALGCSLTILMPERFRAAHTAGILRLAQGQAPTLIGTTIELIGLTHDGREFPIELSLASWHAKEGIFFSGIIRDITRRRDADAAIARLSRHNALILDNAGEGIFGLDAQGCATFVNATAARILGWSAEELIGRPMAPLLYHVDDDASRRLDPFSLHAALRDGAVHRVENDGFRRKDGRAIPVHYVTSPIREDNRIEGAVVVFQDITERRRMDTLQQAQLSISHTLARTDRIDEAVPLLLRVTAEMGSWDMALCWHPVPESDALVCREAWIRPTHDWEEFVTLSRTRPCPPAVDFPGLAKSGKLPLWIPDIVADPRGTRTPTAARLGIHGACAVPIRTGGTIHGVLELFSHQTRPHDHRLLHVMADTGMKIGQFVERTHSAQALRDAHDMTQSLLTGLPGAILLCAEDLTVHYANEPAHRYFAGADGRLVGRRLSQFLALSESATQRLVDEWAAAPESSTSEVPERECEVGARLFRYRLFSVTAPTTSRSQFGVVLWDMTEQKQLQDQLIQAEKLSSLGTMVSGMAHEINNPSQAILSMAELIQDEPDPAKVKEFAADIVGYARHVSTVVRDFSSYARAAGMDTSTVVDVGERLHDAIKMVRRGPHFGDIDVVTRFEALGLVRGRKGELDQVFVNLISNAAQAMNGRGTLTLTTSQDDAWVSVEVADNGPGIPPEVLPKIFDPFFTTKAAGKGTGLGLSIAHKIMMKHRGTIGVQSVVGEGTTFSIRLPSAQAS